MDANKLKSVYFIGAGGIGMSALVRYFLSKDIKLADEPALFLNQIGLKRFELTANCFKNDSKIP